MTAQTCADWNARLRQARLGVGAAELHGSLTGFLCAGWGGSSHDLLAALALDAGAGDADLHAMVERAATDIAARLRKGEPVELLLPSAPLAARADAMVDWCRGFLGGLGLTGLLDTAAQAPAERELLAGLARIAETHVVCADGDTRALDEVLGFIRAGVRDLYAIHAPGPA